MTPGPSHAGSRYAWLNRRAGAGGSLAPDAPTASIHDPDAFLRTAAGLEPAIGRAGLHRELYADWDDLTPRVSRRRVAVICGGPHGAGKSRLIEQLLTESGFVPHRFRRIDPELTADALLSKLSWQRPDGLDRLGPAGFDDRLLPRELAPLVAHEARRLSGGMLTSAAERGDNMVIETTLSGETAATRLVDTLAARGYEIHLATIEASAPACQRRVERRYAAELADYDAGRDLGAEGPRFTSSATVAADFSDSGAPRASANAGRLARTSVVRTHQRYQLAPGTDAPVRVGLEQPLAADQITPAQFEAMRVSDMTAHMGHPVRRVSRRGRPSKTARRDDRGSGGPEL